MSWIPWIITVFTVGISSMLIAAYRRKAARLLVDAREEHEMQVRLLEDESDSRLRRLERESESTKTLVRDALVEDILPVFDSLDMAARSTKDPDTERGISLVQAELVAALRKHGIAPIEPSAGEAYDPALHEAAEVVEVADFEPGNIARTYRIGLRTSDRVIRPAIVAVVQS